MLRRNSGLIALVLAVALGFGLHAQTAADLALQGSWVVVGAEHDGQPMTALNGGIMTVTNTRFEIHTACGNLLRGELRLDPKKTPAQMDFLHDDGRHWEAIYEVNGDDFKINYVAAGGKDQRPASFSTSPDTEASLVILKRKND